MNEQGTRHLVDHWLWLVVTWDEENKCVQKYIIFPQLWCNKRIYDCWIIIFFVLQEKSFQNFSISWLHLSKVDRSLRYLKFNKADTYIIGTLFFSQSIRLVSCQYWFSANTKTKMFCIIPIDKEYRNQSKKLDTYVPNTDLLGKSLRTWWNPWDT